MAEAIPDRRQTDQQMSIQTTTTGALGLAGGGSLVLYAIDCIQAGELLTPSREDCLFLAALLAPVVHQIGRIVLYHLNRLGGGSPAA